MTTNDDWIPSADILMNERLIAINSFSGYGLGVIELEVPEYLLQPDVEDTILGSSALAALQNSRSLSLEAYRELDKKVEEIYQGWVGRAMKSGGYKAKRALFLHMKSCSIQRKDQELVISPSHHEALEGWSGIRQQDGSILEFSIPLESTPEEVGAAIRLGFMHCTGR